jgi:hypothetical protein
MSKTRRNGYREGEFQDRNEKRIRRNGSPCSQDKKYRKHHNDNDWFNDFDREEHIK